jgi:hypothetical protein
MQMKVNRYNILVEKPEGKRRHERPRIRWKDNTGWTKISAGISNMNHLFAALGVATKPTTFLRPPFKVLFRFVTVT